MKITNVQLHIVGIISVNFCQNWLKTVGFEHTHSCLQTDGQTT